MLCFIRSLIADLLVRLRLLAPNPVFVGSDTEIASQIVAPLRFDRPAHEGFLERHIVQIARALRATGQPVSLASLLSRLCTEALLDLSYDLNREAGVELRSYLADLPEGIDRLFTQAQNILARRLQSPAKACLRRWHVAVRLRLPRLDALNVHKALGFALLYDGEVTADQLSRLHNVDPHKALGLLRLAATAELLRAPAESADPCRAPYRLTRRGMNKVFKRFQWRISWLGNLIDQVPCSLAELKARAFPAKKLDGAARGLIADLLERQPGRMAMTVIDERSTMDTGRQLSAYEGRVRMELGRQRLSDGTRRETGRD
jgi:hypothetical protein